MRDDRESSGGVGVLVAALVVLVLLVCGGGALLMTAIVFFFVRSESVGIPVPPPAATAPPFQAAHADVLAIDADGSLLWNGAPITSSELRQRLDGLKNAAGPPRSVILRTSRAAPAATRDELVQLLNDRGVSYLEEASQ